MIFKIRVTVYYYFIIIVFIFIPKGLYKCPALYKGIFRYHKRRVVLFEGIYFICAPLANFSNFSHELRMHSLTRLISISIHL